MRRYLSIALVILCCGWTHGSAIVSGFTTVVATSPVCQGLNSSCSGSQVIYISESLGTNNSATGSCTQSAPCKTCAFGIGKLRNNSSDQLLLNGADHGTNAWPTTDSCAIGSLNGTSACSSPWTELNGGNCTGPILIGYYNGSSGRPEIDTSGGNNCFPISAASGSFNNIVVQGIYCHAIDRDPTLSTYSFTSSTNNPAGFINSTILTSWVLFEDNECAYYQFCASIQANSSTQNGTVIFRRNIFVHTYSFGAIFGSDFSGDSSGIFISGTTSPTFDSNVFYMTGWDNILTAPQTVSCCSAGANTLTWPVSNYAFNSLPFGSGAALYVQSSGGGLSTNTPYCVTVVSASAGTFKVSATFSGGTSCGTAASLSGSSYVMQWSDPALQSANHSIYASFVDGGGPGTLINNISLWSNDLMVLTGGTATGNVVSNDANMITEGSYAGQEGGGEPTITSLTYSQNLHQHRISTYPGANLFSYPSDGNGWAFGLNNASGSGIQITHNIFSMLASSTIGVLLSAQNAGDTANTVTQNNLFFTVGTAVDNNGNSDNVVTPQYCIDLNGSNNNSSPSGGCTPEPFPSPTRDLFSYDSTQIGGPSSCSGTGPSTPSGVASIIGTGNNCMADFVTQETSRAPGTWPTNLIAGAIISYVKTGFGNPF